MLLGFLRRLLHARSEQPPVSPVHRWLVVGRLGAQASPQRRDGQSGDLSSGPPPPPSQRRHARWALSEAVTVRIGERCIPAQAVDIAEAGIGLLLSEPLTSGQVVELVASDGAVTAARVVHASRPDGSGRFRAGLLFQPPDVPATRLPGRSAQAAPPPASASPVHDTATANVTPVQPAPTHAGRPAPDDEYRPPEGAESSDASAASPSPPPEEPAPPAPAVGGDEAPGSVGRPSLSVASRIVPAPTEMAAPPAAATVLAAPLALPAPAPAPSLDQAPVAGIPAAERPAAPAETQPAPAASGAPAAVPGPAESDQAPGLTPQREADLESPPWWVPRGEPTLQAPLPRAGTEAGAAFLDYVQRSMEAGEIHLPALSKVVRRALTLLDDPRVDARRLAEVVGEDAALAARVLRVANSVAHARLARVVRLDDAIARLGLRVLRWVITTMGLRELALRPGDPLHATAQAFWQRSAVFAAILAESARGFHLAEDQAYLAGLLHDIGYLVLLDIGRQYLASGAALDRDAFEQTCEALHERCGRLLAESWKLHHPLPEIIGDHHRPVVTSVDVDRYRLALQFAQVVSAMLGYAPYVPYDFFRLPCVRALGVEDTPGWHAFLAVLPARVIERTGLFSQEDP